MNLLRKNNGYTLVEVLVGINLAFIVITLIFTFYLYSSRIISVFTTKAVAKHEINTSLNSLYSLLNDSQDFEVQYSDERCMILLNDRKDSVLISQDKISIKNVYFIEDIDEINLFFSMNSGDDILLDFSGNQAVSLSGINEKILSKNIVHIRLLIEKDKNKFDFDFVSPGISNRRFINIGENDNQENIN